MNKKQFINSMVNGDLKNLEENDSFDFKCSNCGGCCTNRNGEDGIPLYPYDVWYLAKGLRLSTEKTINKYTETHLGAVSKLSVPVLKTFFGACIFLQNGLCHVHNCKPAVCAIYPLGRTVDGSKIKYFTQPHSCKGEQVLLKDHIQKFNLDKSAQGMILFTNFVLKLKELINFEKFDVLSKKHIAIYTKIVEKLYVNLDINKDFEETFNETSELVFAMLKLFIFPYKVKGLCENQDELTKEIMLDTLGKYKKAYAKILRVTKNGKETL